VSFGKDSLAMVLRLMEENKPLDEVVFYDTGMEFEAIYHIRDKVVTMLKAKGIKYTELKPDRPFMYDMLEKPIESKQKGKHNGYGWCGGCARWGTTFKVTKIDQYKKQFEDLTEYVGIAYDEKKRHKIISKTTVAPLVDFGIDEDLCGLHCKYEGILSPSYESSYRDGCWFCHNQGVDQLRHLRKEHPKLWQLLLKWDADSPIPFKADGRTVHDYDNRFMQEDLGIVPIDRTFRWSMLNEERQMRFIGYE
jgi:hypothetical protein